MTGDVRVVYRKHDGSLHWHLSTRWLGADEYGVWTGTARPTVIRKGEDPPMTLDYASIMLFPRDAWWTATFNDAPATTRFTATSPRQRVGRASGRSPWSTST